MPSTAVWRWLLFLLIARKAWASGNRTITIALLSQIGWDDSDVQVPQYLKWILVPNRTILPDYEVNVEIYPGTIEDARAQDQLAQVLHPSSDARQAHAVMGPFDNLGPEQTIRMASASRLLQLHEADSPQLSDRVKYPYSFRGNRPSSGHVICWYWIIKQNGWNLSLSFWQTSGEKEHAWVTGKRFGITDYGMQLELGTESSTVTIVHSAAVALLRRHRMRVAVSFLGLEEQAASLACFISRSGFPGLQWFLHASFDPGWWEVPYEGVPCSAEEMVQAVYGYVTATHAIIAPGTNFLGLVQAPKINGSDDSLKPLTCAPHMTSDDFYNSGELLGLGIAMGRIYDMGSAFAFMSTAGVYFEMVCLLVLTLHDAIYRKSISLEDIEKRTDAVYQTLTMSLLNVSLFGPAGTFSYSPVTQEPEYQVIWATQYCKTSKPSSVVDVDAYLYFPRGPEYDPEIVFTSQWPWEWQDGSIGLGPKPHLNQYPDCAAEYGELVGYHCIPCPAGTYYDAQFDGCRQCDRGEYQGEAGMSACLVSPPGSYIANPEMPTEATPCPVAHECADAAMLQPVPCPVGTFSDTIGASSCELCALGRYQAAEGSTSCHPCSDVINGSTTRERSSEDAARCKCPAGSYLPERSSACHACPAFMDCEFGSDAKAFALLDRLQSDANEGLENLSLVIPIVRRGYMTLPDSPLIVYKCSDPNDCPGGVPGSCDKNRDPSVVACGSCETGAYMQFKKCQICGSSANSWLLFVAVSFAGLVTIMVGTCALSVNVHKARLATISMVAITGLLFISLQSIGAFNQIDIAWKEPLRSILGAMQLLTFDLRLLKLECMIGPSTVRSYAARLVLGPTLAAIVFLSIACKKYIPACGEPTTRLWLEFSNALGTIFNIIFISMVVSAMAPYLCYKHPDGNGESVQSMPAILCFESSNHQAIAAAGAGMLLTVPIPFLVLCGVAVYKYPQAMRRHNSNTFLAATRFLFFRFTPASYFFQLVVLMRSLLIGVVPALLRDKPGLQITATSVVLGAYMCIEQEVQPWRSKMCNVLDGLLTAMLLLVLVCAAIFMEDQGETAVQDIGLLVVLTMIVIGTLLLSGLAIGFWRRNVRKGYDFFICHHKADAAAQARLLKLLLEEHRSFHVFLDSDNLEHLDELFDVVASQIRQLVVYLSADTLRRPWCAGEITIAWRVRARVRRTKVITDAFVPPSELELLNLDQYVNTQTCNLEEYGIDWQDVQHAYRALEDLPGLRLSSTLAGTARFIQVCDSLTLRSSRLLDVVSSERLRQETGAIYMGGVVLSVNPDDTEALAAGAIVAEMLRPHVYNFCSGGLAFLPDHLESDNITGHLTAVCQAKSVVVMLSPGSMLCDVQVAVMCEVARIRISGLTIIVVPVVTPNFEFPSPIYYEEVLPSLPFVEHELIDYPDTMLQAFFRVVSIFLPTHGSKTAIRTQIQAVISRLEHKARLGMALSMQSQSSPSGSGFFGIRHMSSRRSGENLRIRSAASNASSGGNSPNVFSPRSPASHTAPVPAMQRLTSPRAGGYAWASKSSAGSSAGESPRISVVEDCKGELDVDIEIASEHIEEKTHAAAAVRPKMSKFLAETLDAQASKEDLAIGETVAATETPPAPPLLDVLKAGPAAPLSGGDRWHADDVKLIAC